LAKKKLNQSIPDRFEKIVRRYANSLAIKGRSVTRKYAELNEIANRVARTILVFVVKGKNL
jgi:hypothetical protein